MTSSGIKRGVATFAISALAVAGLPLLAGTASATPHTTNLGATQVALYQPFGCCTSTANDGQNTTVSLLASAGSSITSIQFQFSTDGGTSWTNIGSPVARNADGVFGAEWASPPATLTTVRAVGGPGGTNDSNSMTHQPAATDAVEMDSEGSIGVFQAPYAGPDDGDYVGVTGTVSEDDDVFDVSDQSHGTADSQDATEAEGPGESFDIWNAVVDITGYPYSPGSESNQIVFGSFTNLSSDAEGSTLYIQTIGSITADPVTQEDATPADATTTLTVLDTQGNPVAHAQVYRGGDTDTDGGGTDTDTDGAEELVGYTDGFGKIEADPAAGPEAGPGVAGTEKYYANTTGNTAYESGTDPAVDVTVTTYVPVLTTVDIVNDRNRSNFDLDEFGDSDDFTIVTKDQRGKPINEDLAGADVEYRYIFNPDAPGADTTTAWLPGETDANGEFQVPSPSGFGQGTYTLEARRPNVAGTGLTNATPEMFEGSEAEITFDEGNDANAPVNGLVTITGSLDNVDGPLAGREIELGYTPTSLGADADFAPQAEQPAGADVVPDAGGPGSTVFFVTGADGGFSVALRDPAIPPNVDPTEEDGTLDAQADETATDTTDLNADNSIDVHWIEFPDVTSIDIDTDTILDGQFGPGRPADFKIEVFGDEDEDPNTADTELEDYPVTVEVDKGFLTPYNGGGADGLTLAEGQDDEGDLWGFFENLGTSQETSTGDNGLARVAGAIERDVDFDDNGLADMTVTVTAGDVTETDTVTMDSGRAINVASTDLRRDEGEPAGPVEVGNELDFNWDVIDQFGNLSGDYFAGVTDDSTVADFDTEEDFDTIRSDYTTSGPSVMAFSNAPTTQVLMAMFTANEYLVDDSSDLEGSGDDRAATADSDPIVWVAEAGGRTPIEAVLKGRGAGEDIDKLKVVTTPRGVADGARVNLFRFNKKGVRVLVESSELNANGVKRFQVVDTNEGGVTRYVARIKRTDDSKGVRRTNFKEVH